jgi:hypothetical protein
MMRLAAALLLVSTPVAAHDARGAEVFTFTSSQRAIAAGASSEPGVIVTGFAADLDYADGHRESVAGRCEAREPSGGTFNRSGLCRAPGAFTIEFHCQPAGQAEADCWGSLIGAREGYHHGLTGLVAYHVGPEGVVGVGRWTY